MKAWKAFRKNAKGEICFLFRTHNGSSVVPLNQWLVAKKKWVKEGGGTSKKFRSGFHFFYKEGSWDKFNKLTKNKYFILPVKVKNVREKPRSSVGSWLAQKVYVGHPK